ncbi:MAG TPA: protein kinase [Kofleriaceae bacterium]|nr:protein kinase [Kofleriaceae bacterium]
MGQPYQGDETGLVGRELGEFVLREPLSQGGFGVVYRAEQPALGREAVIKILHARLLASPTIVQRFLLEAKLASRLDHPYAAHIYAFGAEPDGLLWIAMELVRGTPLSRILIDEGSVSLERFVPLLERICEVVHGAHEQGIVHRDLKPANVMVLERSGRLLPKLLDFGIAKVDLREQGLALAVPATRTPTSHTPVPTPIPSAAPPAATTDDQAATLISAHSAPRPGSDTEPAPPHGRITEVGITMGSPLYMAPEQWRDSARVGPRTDIYGLGVLCYEALTGQPPFTGQNTMDLAIAHSAAPVPPLGDGFPPALDGVLARALAKRPDDRYGSALELAAAFRVASGIAAEPAAVPRLDAGMRAVALTALPRPLALAVDALDAARNAHQARDAVWQLLRTSIRVVSLLAIAAQGHVELDAHTTGSGAGDALRRLRERHPSDATWLQVARALAQPFAAVRDAHPLPPLIDFLLLPRTALDELLELRDESESGGAGEEHVLDIVERALEGVALLVEQLAFLHDHRVVVPRDATVAEDWTGARRDRPTVRLAPERSLAIGRPVLVDRRGAPVVALWPFVQLHEPSPGAGRELFLFDGRGRRGARLVALPDPFEREDEELWNAVGSLLHETGETTGAESMDEVCPFPGLAAYGGGDAHLFTGRERESESFLNRMRVQPLLTVVGPSGAGKSSFVQAGVLPALPDGWRALTVRPGPAPMVSLVARAEALGLDGDRLRAAPGPGAVAGALRAWADEQATTLVVVIDQLEELFTLCADQRERERFAEEIAALGRAVDDPLRVVLTVRDDFLLRFESLPALRARLGPGLQLLTTPLEPDLRRILVEPLRRAGYEFEDPSLPQRMIGEVAATPSALALLSFTASKLWELRDRRFRHLTARAYESLGGVGGALAQHAEATLVDMHPEQQRLVREVFRHAVTAEGTRAVLTRGELTEVLGAHAHAGHVLEKLLAARLLVVSDDPGGGERIEITHEALLDAWPRLVAWRREDAEGARLRDQLRAAARQWEQRGRPSGLLWRGDALAEYRLWRARYPGALTVAEEAFAAAGLIEAARGRRLRRAAVGAVGLALVAFAVVLLFQNARVERQRARAIDSERAAQEGSHRLAELLRDQYEAQGRRLLLGGDAPQALAYLHKASQLGVSGRAHDFLMAQAIRATDGQLFALGHDGVVTDVRYSPDGSLVVTTGQDNRARLWDSSSGVMRAELPHAGPLHHVAWSPRGDRLVTGAKEGLAMWDAQGTQVWRVARPAAVQAVAFCAGGTRVVAATTQDEIALFDAATGRLLASLLEPAGAPFPPAANMLGVSRDGAMVVAGDRNGMLHLWDARSARVLAAWQAHAESVSSVELSPDGAQIVSTSANEQSALVWDRASRRRLRALPHKGGIYRAEFSPDGRQIVTASSDSTAVVWSPDGTPRLTLGGHAAGVWDATWSPDGTMIATAGGEGTVQLWEEREGRLLARRVGHRGGVRRVAFHPSGRTMVSASLDGRGIIWTTEPTLRVTLLRGHGDAAVYSAEFAPSGAHVLTASGDRTARVWDAATGRELLVLRHDASLAIARYSPDGRRIATGSDDGTVQVWDALTGSRLETKKLHDGFVLDVGWDAAGGRVVSAGADGEAHVWQLDDGAPIRTFDHGGAALQWAAFHPSRPVIATSGVDNKTRLWDADSGRELAVFEDPRQRGAGAFDPTGQRLVSATANRTAIVWRPDTGAIDLELRGHLGTVKRPSWSADGAFIITASHDGTLRVWDAARGDVLASFLMPDAWAMSAHFSPDGARVVAGRGDGLAEIWELPTLASLPAPIEQVVRCRAPYDTAGEEIVPRAEVPADCAGQR